MQGSKGFRFMGDVNRIKTKPREAKNFGKRQSSFKKYKNRKRQDFIQNKIQFYEEA